MITGISTACFYPMLTEEAIDLIAGLGFKTIEFFINAEHEYNRQYLARQKEKLDRLNISITSIHSYSTAFEHFLLFSQYDRRYSEGLRIFGDLVNAAAILGAKYISFHGITTLMSSIPNKECAKTYRDLINIARRRNIIIAQENVSYCRSASLEFISFLTNEFSKDELMFTLDIKQAKRAKTELSSYLDAMEGRIANIHINDNTDTHDCLLPGAGSVNYNRFFKKLKAQNYSGNFIIEVYRYNFGGINEVSLSKKHVDALIKYFDN